MLSKVTTSPPLRVVGASEVKVSDEVTSSRRWRVCDRHRTLQVRLLPKLPTVLKSEAVLGSLRKTLDATGLNTLDPGQSDLALLLPVLEALALMLFCNMVAYSAPKKRQTLANKEVGGTEKQDYNISRRVGSR